MNDFNIIFMHQCPWSQDTKMSDPVVYMALQSAVEQLHVHQRQELVAAWEELNGQIDEL